MPLQEVPAIIDGKKTTVKLTEKRKKFVEEKAKSIAKGNIISDAEAYRRAFNYPNKTAEQVGNGTNSVVKDCKVKGAIAYYTRAIEEKLTPECYARELKEAITQETGKGKVPGLELAAKVFQLIGQPNQGQTNVNNGSVINFYG